MKRKLIVVEGPEAGREFEVAIGEVFVIGRGRQTHTKIQDPSVSRSHCHIEWEQGRAILVDTGGSSGTFVGPQAIERHPLTVGTTFRIGDTLLRFDVATVDQPTIRPAAAPRPARSVPKIESLVGHTLGDYHLDKILAPTRSGMLFLGRHKSNAAPIAIKVLAPNLLEPDEQKRRFLRAMRTMLPLRHENLVRLYHAGKNGPFCWTAMEYVEGESAAQMIDRIGVSGKLEWREAWRLAYHVGRALKYAFDQRIIHRNLTPNNILRRTSDKTYLLGDLMLAKALDVSPSNLVTSPGSLVGDLAYMAPERTYGTGVVDTRSDLYGLGATLYALLTGRPPFVADSLVELVRLVRDNNPLPPREFQLGIDEAFADVVLTLLEKRPQRRFQSAATLLLQLEKIARAANIKIVAT